MRGLRRAIVLVAVVLCGASACSMDGGAQCAAGDYRYCDCPSAKQQGYALCKNDGSGYGACDCSGAIPSGAGILVEAGVADAGATAAPSGSFLSPCSSNNECASGLCFSFNAYGPHCSQP